MAITKVKWTADYGSHQVEHNLSIVSYSSIAHKFSDYRVVGQTGDSNYYLVLRNKFNGEYLALDTTR